MLLELHIRNLALFDDATVELGPGLNVLTGETGAGKSLVAGALGLVLGDRGEADRIRTGEDVASVEALFATGPVPDLDAFLEEAGLASPSRDDEGQVLLRRVIRRSSRGTSYVNGSLAPLAQVSAVADRLVSIYGQHGHQRLLRPSQHRRILDAAAGLAGEAEALAPVVRALRAVLTERAELAARDAERESELDFVRFQIEEIERIAPGPGEDESLASERSVLRHAEELATLAREALDHLDDSSGAALERVGLAERALDRAAELDPGLAELAESLAPVRIGLEEAGRSLRAYADRATADPARLAEVEDRLAELSRLGRKHGGDLAGVLARLEELRADRDRLEEGPSRLRDLVREEEELRADARKRARALGKGRAAGAAELARALEEELGSLGMEGARFEARVDGPGRRAEEDPEPWGWDEVRFLVSPNAGEDPRPLDRIASGGELSRVLLALTRRVGDGEERPVLLFDEVDAGIGGAVAEVVGRKLVEISRGRQVLCITHLPQIASLADRHVRVWKEEQGGRTVARVEPVEGADRVREVARMLGGTDLTEATLAHAEEMLARPDGARSAGPASGARARGRTPRAAARRRSGTKAGSARRS